MAQQGIILVLDLNAPKYPHLWHAGFRVSSSVRHEISCMRLPRKHSNIAGLQSLVEISRTAHRRAVDSLVLLRKGWVRSRRGDVGPSLNIKLVVCGHWFPTIADLNTNANRTGRYTSYCRRSLFAQLFRFFGCNSLSRL